VRLGHLLAIAVAIAGLLHDRAGAHAGLRFSSPLDGSTLGDSPSAVHLTFVEPPEPSLSTIRVIDTLGAAHHDGRPAGVDNDPLSLTIAVRPLGRGVYTVQWRVVSAVDGHASGGSFAFGVQMAPGGAQASAATEVEAGSTTEAIARAIFLAGLVVLLGAAAAHLGRFGAGREIALAGGGWVLAIAGLALLIVEQRRVAGVAVAEVIGTGIGRALLWRSVALGAAGAALACVLGARRTASPRVAALGMAAAAMATLAAIAVHAAAGHAGAGRWPLVPSIAAQTVHVAAVGVWLGGLAALVAGLRGAPSEAKAAAVRRFSRVAAGGLAIVIATGVVRSVTEISRWADLLTTDYGRVVTAKVALLVVIAALGAINRWFSLPRAAATLAPLRRAAGVELTLTTAAIVASGALGTLAPPAAIRAASGIVASGADFATTVRVRVTAASDYPGPNRFTVHVDDYDTGAPVTADRVALRFTPLDDPGIAPGSLTLVRGPDHAYVGSGAQLTFEGRWRITVHVERAGRQVDVPLDVETRATPQRVSVERLPGQAPNYTVFVPKLGFVRFTPGSERAGPSRIIVTCLDVLSEYRRMEHMAIAIVDADGVWREQPVQRLDQYRFATDIALSRGRTRIAATARSADGARMRGIVEIDAGR
jgi:copper transport protein